ncbi:TCP-1/cpn60 chaperonin family protein [Tanacetum coccineum]
MGRNVVLQNKYGHPKIVNDGKTVLKEIQLKDPLENVGMKPVSQASAKIIDIAGDRIYYVCPWPLIAEGVKSNRHESYTDITRDAKKCRCSGSRTLMSREVEDHELSDIAAISAADDVEGAATKGMQFDHGYLSIYLTFELLLVDKIITNPKEIYKVLDSAVKGDYPVVIIAEHVEKEVLPPVIRNKLKGILMAAAVRAPCLCKMLHVGNEPCYGFLATVIREEAGLSLERVREDMLGRATNIRSHEQDNSFQRNSFLAEENGEEVTPTNSSLKMLLRRITQAGYAIVHEFSFTKESEGMSSKTVGEQKMRRTIQQAGEICMLQVLAVEGEEYSNDLQVKVVADAPVSKDIQQLIQKNEQIFQDPVNHKLTLKEGSNHVNLRPYTYPVLQKRCDRKNDKRIA